MSFVIIVVIVPMTTGGGEFWNFPLAEFRPFIAVQMPTALLLLATLAGKDEHSIHHRSKAPS